MDGSGTGKLNGKQIFVCRANFALFRPIESVLPEKDFLVGHPKNITGRTTWEKVRQEQIRGDEMLARSMSYSGDTSGNNIIKYAITCLCFWSQVFVQVFCFSACSLLKCYMYN